MDEPKIIVEMTMRDYVQIQKLIENYKKTLDKTRQRKREQSGHISPSPGRKIIPQMKIVLPPINSTTKENIL